ncbi:hypothetical protein RJ640_030151 [Escallonia rubra]|uniref:Uncharacterized protein n=1 Tax=Escallonia rubra TaxID=112253 RepID=A0AA88UC42_9ASTE|nr:hypothetical protein RJ640_030151 [Escallonia rubra]
MYQAPQPLLPNHSDISNPNPNSAPAGAPYLVITSQPSLLPPGTHSSQYRPHTPDPRRYPGIQFQPALYPDPNAVFQNVAVTQPDPNAYPPTHLKMLIHSSRKSALLCEVCSIYCDTKDVLDNHMLGKKHKKNLQLKMYLAGATPSTGATPTTGVPPTMGTTPAAASAEVQNGGLGPTVPAAPMIFCTICHIACNSPAMFDNHLAGKRHAKINVVTQTASFEDKQSPTIYVEKLQVL